MSLRYFFYGVAILAIFFALASFSIGIIEGDSIELTKEEALALKDAHTAFILAQADLKELASRIYAKYGVDDATYDIDLRAGRLIPKKEKK